MISDQFSGWSRTQWQVAANDWFVRHSAMPAETLNAAIDLQAAWYDHWTIEPGESRVELVGNFWTPPHAAPIRWVSAIWREARHLCTQLGTYAP